jgi:hypothetical protein
MMQMLATSDEISATTREHAEQAVGQVEDALHDVLTACRQALTTFETDMALAQHDMTEIGLTGVRCAEQNVALAFGFAHKMLWAKDLGEVMNLQAEFVRAQGKLFSEETQKIGRSVTKAAVDVAKS